MGAAAAVTIQGTEELKAKLKALGVDLGKELAKSGRRAMEINVETPAKQKCPVDTGNLRASIDTQSEGEMTIKTGSNVEYAADVEYGTERQRAQPYLRPAFDEGKKQVLEDVKADLKAIVEKYTK